MTQLDCVWDTESDPRCGWFGSGTEITQIYKMAFTYTLHYNT